MYEKVLFPRCFNGYIRKFSIDVLLACINNGDFFVLLLRGTQLMNRETNDFSCSISSIRRSVSSPDETLRRELKKYDA